MVKRKTILLVEDDAEIRETVREILEECGYPVLLAFNGQMALELLKSGEKPALILLDMMMPVMDGMQFLKLVKEDVTLATIPVVIATAGKDISDLHGAQSLVRKPFRLEALLEVAERYCGPPHSES